MGRALCPSLRHAGSRGIFAIAPEADYCSFLQLRKGGNWDFSPRPPDSIAFLPQRYTASQETRRQQQLVTWHKTQLSYLVNGWTGLITTAITYVPGCTLPFTYLTWSSHQPNGWCYDYIPILKPQHWSKLTGPGCGPGLSGFTACASPPLSILPPPLRPSEEQLPQSQGQAGPVPRTGTWGGRP